MVTIIIIRLLAVVHLCVCTRDEALDYDHHMMFGGLFAYNCMSLFPAGVA